MDGKEIMPFVSREMQKIQVIIIRRKGESILVQYTREDTLQRCTIPVAQLDNNLVDDQVLQAGIPYGYPWEDIQLTFDMKKFMNELHQVDIWTAEDLLKSPQKLWSALRAALADSLSNVLDIARNEHKGVRHG